MTHRIETRTAVRPDPAAGPEPRATGSAPAPAPAPPEDLYEAGSGARTPLTAVSGPLRKVEPLRRRALALAAAQDHTPLRAWGHRPPWSADFQASLPDDIGLHRAFLRWTNGIMGGSMWLEMQLKRCVRQQMESVWLRDLMPVARDWAGRCELLARIVGLGTDAPPFTPEVLLRVGGEVQAFEDALPADVRFACRAAGQQTLRELLSGAADAPPTLTRAHLWAVCLVLRQSELTCRLYWPELRVAERRAQATPWQPLTLRPTRNRMARSLFSSADGGPDPWDERLKDMLETPLAAAALARLPTGAAATADDTVPPDWLQPLPETLRAPLRVVAEVLPGERRPQRLAQLQALAAIDAELVGMHEDVTEGGGGQRLAALLAQRPRLYALQREVQGAEALLATVRQEAYVPEAAAPQGGRGRAKAGKAAKGRGKRAGAAGGGPRPEPGRAAPTVHEEAPAAPAATAAPADVPPEAPPRAPALPPPHPELRLFDMVFPSRLLSTDRLLDQVDLTFEAGSFSSALRSVAYHYFKHRRPQADGRPMLVEDYLARARQAVRPLVRLLREGRPLPPTVYADCDVTTSEVVFVLREPFTRFSAAGKVYTFSPSA